MKKYWVYDNEPNRYAKIHKAWCPYCRHGKGMSGMSNRERSVDKWISFENFPAAEKEAKRRKGKKAKKCGFCFSKRFPGAL